MKNVPFVLLLTLLALVSCQKEPIPKDPSPPIPDPPIYVPIFEPGDTSKGAAYANKLTALWSAGTYCKRSIYDSTKLLLTLFTYTPVGSRRESLSLSLFSSQNPGVYKLLPSGNSLIPSIEEVLTAYGTWSSDGDVVEDGYRVDTTDVKNTLVITKIDLANKRVEGNFHVSYNIREPRINPANPKKVTFSEGRFWADIRE
ncbi:MAG: hypothetical protein KA138_04530 [Saprospiraceae bacterium]|nr:hypothetical protein [Saprospiraceae bacterium]